MKLFGNNKGIALITTILTMTLMLFMATYFLNFSMTENRIAKSQSIGAKAYYLAETGVADMIWKIKNDNNYKNNFEDNEYWTTEFTKNIPFGVNSGSYTVSIANSSKAHGEIVATGQIDLGINNSAQRIIKVSIYKAKGESVIDDSAAFSDGNIDISGAKVNFYDGSAYSNNNFILNNSSEMFVEGDLKTVGNYLEHITASTTITGSIYAHNYQPEPAPIPMPGIDFDSTATTSYKNLATVTYTENQFKTLLENNSNLTLNGIIYVDGEVDIEKSIDLTINGLLVVNKEFEIDSDDDHHHNHGQPIVNLTINNTPGQPSGILAKDEIEFDHLKGSININGLVYATDKIEIENISSGDAVFNINGAAVSRKLTITSAWSPINITHNNDIVSEILVSEDFAPLVIVDHWEEEY